MAASIKREQLNKMKQPNKRKQPNKKKLPEKNVDDTKSSKPSKASKREIKQVIEGLKKDPSLLLARKALKYIPSYLKSTGLTKKLLKEVIRLWASSHEKIRVISLLCIIRIFRKQSQPIRAIITKKMYTNYMSNSKTSIQTLPLLVFMRQSLVEIYSLDQPLAYKQGFTFCKQLASTLKNAYENKTETYKTVYNWQYINCLILWSNLIASLMPNKNIEQLMNPVIQLHMGTINLISSPRYYPLYLHLIGNLVNLSVKLDVFIPVLPLMTSILDRLKFNPNSKPTKIESFDFDVLINVSANDVQSNHYITATVDRLYELIVRYLASQSHKISFPELCLLAQLQMKKFVKKNKKEAGKFRDLLAKLEENIQFIDNRRQTVDFSFNNFSALDAWEKSNIDSGKLSMIKLATKMQKELDASIIASDNFNDADKEEEGSFETNQEFDDEEEDDSDREAESFFNDDASAGSAENEEGDDEDDFGDDDADDDGDEDSDEDSDEYEDDDIDSDLSN